MNSTSAVANEFIDLAEINPGVDNLTNLKLVKLMYISQGLSLAFFDKPLFDEGIEAWMYGPVVPSIYYEFKRFGRGKIEDKSVEFDFEDLIFGDGKIETPSLTDENAKKVVELTWKWYKDIPAGKLIELTHSKGTPWSLTYNTGQNRIIDNKLIKEYYKKFLTNMNRKINA